jgi:hypothetical protein
MKKEEKIEEVGTKGVKISFWYPGSVANWEE